MIGYIVGCHFNKMDKHFLEKIKKIPELQSLLSTNNVLYHKQIVVAPGKKGVGKKLLQALLNEADNKGYQYVFCLIIDKPVKNKVSITFHEKFGFQRIGLIQYEKMIAGVYLKKS